VPRLTWGESGTRLYETGIDRGVLYVGSDAGVAWTGLSSVEESPNGGETKSFYVDGVKYLQVSAAEEFAATINAFMYPDEFGVCDGTAQVRTGMFLTQQRRRTFGLSYRTLIGSDLGPNHGYKIHIVYNAIAQPTQRSYSSTSDSAELSEFSWSLSTRPPAMAGYKRTSHVIIDSRTTEPSVLKAIEDFLYGDDTNPPKLPTLSELTDLYDTPDFSLTVTDNGDGTFTITGPDSAVQELTSTTFQVIWPTVTAIDADTYSISS
jgi:hypothetical protein